MILLRADVGIGQSFNDWITELDDNGGIVFQVQERARDNSSPEPTDRIWG
jgi:hypothetical protein